MKIIITIEICAEPETEQEETRQKIVPVGADCEALLQEIRQFAKAKQPYGKLITRLRRDVCKQSQYEFAQTLGVSARTVYRAERLDINSDKLSTALLGYGWQADRE